MEAYNEKDNYGQFQAFKSGDINGFNYFFNLYYKRLCYFACSITKDEPVAEEIADDAFLKLWYRHHLFENKKLIKAFLYKVVRNSSINYLRKSKTQAKFQKDIDYLAETSEPCIQSHIIRAETINLIYQSLDILPEKSLKVFKLFYLENKSYEEIITELHVSINSVRNHKMRALTLLKKKLGASLLLCIAAALNYLLLP